jgi:hypothetical protein
MPEPTASHIVLRGTKEGNHQLREVYKSANKSVCFAGKMEMF